MKRLLGGIGIVFLWLLLAAVCLLCLVGAREVAKQKRMANLLAYGAVEAWDIRVQKADPFLLEGAYHYQLQLSVKNLDRREISYLEDRFVLRQDPKQYDSVRACYTESEKRYAAKPVLPVGVSGELTLLYSSPDNLAGQEKSLVYDPYGAGQLLGSVTMP